MLYDHMKYVISLLIFLQTKKLTFFQKGTFLIRYSDLQTLESDQIWRVDNHHLLLKYYLSTHIEGKHRLYLKSQPERVTLFLI